MSEEKQSKKARVDYIYDNMIMRDRLMCPLAKDRLVDFYKNEQFVDCIFKIGDKLVKAHRIILACNSPVFEKLLYGEMANPDTITLTDVAVDDFRDVIDYIYTSELDITSVGYAWSIFYIANKYLLKDLMDSCLSYVKDNLSLSNLVLSFEYADMYMLKDLKQRCLDDMVIYFNAIFVNYHMKVASLRSVLEKLAIYTKNGNYSLIINIITWAMEECEIKEITPNGENVYDILISGKILKYLSRNSLVLECDDCDKMMNMCDCIDVTIRNILEYLTYCVAPWQSARMVCCEPTKLRAMKFLGVRFRDIYKISQRVDLSKSEEFTSLIAATKKVALLGVHIFTEMSMCGPTVSYYEGSISVRVLKHRPDNEDPNVVKPSTIKKTFSYDSEYYFPLKSVAVLEPQQMYEVRISYCNLSTGSPTSVVCNYMSSVIFANDRKDSELQFFDTNGTLISGLCLYVF